MKLTKTNLSKIIIWTSSRYNPVKKSRVIADAFEILKNGGIWHLDWKEREEEYKNNGYKTREISPEKAKELEANGGRGPWHDRIEYLTEVMVFKCGSYCEGSIMSGTDYRVNGKTKTIEVGIINTEGNDFDKNFPYNVIQF